MLFTPQAIIYNHIFGTILEINIISKLLIMINIRYTHVLSIGGIWDLGTMGGSHTLRLAFPLPTLCGLFLGLL